MAKPIFYAGARFVNSFRPHFTFLTISLLPLNHLTRGSTYYLLWILRDLTRIPVSADMKTSLLIILYVVAAAVSASAQGPSRPSGPEETKLSGSVEMPLNVKGHLPVIEAKVNGKGPYRFQVDTGFGGSMQLKESIAVQINMPAVGEARSGDPSGRNPVVVRLLRADTVDIATAHFGGVIVSESKRQFSLDIDGVIGLSLFNKLKVRMDYVNNRFSLTDGSLGLDDSLSYTAERGVPSVEIIVAGKKTKVDIDSGSPAQVTLPLGMAKSLPLKAEPTVVGKGRTADGEFDVYGAELKGEVSIADLTLSDPRLDFISVFPMGNLGYRLLQNLIVTFDPANKRVRFERPAKAAGSGITQLAATPTGKRALSYFAAFNSGDDGKLTTFFSDNTSTEALKRRPVEPRVAFHKQVRGDFQKLEIKRIVSVSDGAINVLVQSPSGEWASVTFEIEGSEGKFAGVRVERIDPPAAGTESKGSSAPASIGELPGAVDSLISGLVKADEFSGVVLVAKNDAPLFLKAYGYSDIDKSLANNAETRFNLGSINKLFTRISIGQMVKQGKLSFSDKLIKVLPDYPNTAVAEKVTIGQLVTMTSGMGDFFNAKFDAADKTKIRSQKDYLPFFVNDPLAFEPGTGKRYSNAGYLVLGMVVEKLSGRSYYDYVKENVFKPAGMMNTDSYAMNELPPNTAVGYLQRESGKRLSNVSEQPARGSSAGGGYSTAGDMLKFASALKSMKLVMPKDDGTFPSEFDVAGFAGGSPGVNAVFMSNGKSGYSVIVLSNFGEPSAERPAGQIRDWLKNIRE